MANDEVLGPRKTMFVLVIVVGCFAVLWPRILSPVILGHSREQLKPNQYDREAGCCEVIFEKEVAVLELVNEVCSSALGITKLSPHTAADCRKAVNETCGLDIAAFLKRNENVGKSTKMLVEAMKNSNSSCLREHFGVPIYLNTHTHVATSSWSLPNTVKQERPPIRMGPHPALRERGRAIPPGAPTPSKPVALPPHIRVRSPLSVYYDLDIKPPPIPGMRPPLGSPGGPVPAPKSSMGFVMPIYTICIIVFFVYTLSKILFKRTGSSPYDTVTPDPQFRRRVFRDDSRTSPDKLVVTAISGLVAEVQQEMEASYVQNQQRQDTADSTRPYSNGTVLLNSGPVHIVASEYQESKHKISELQKEASPEPPELTTDTNLEDLVSSDIKEVIESLDNIENKTDINESGNVEISEGVDEFKKDVNSPLELATAEITETTGDNIEKETEKVSAAIDANDADTQEKLDADTSKDKIDSDELKELKPELKLNDDFINQEKDESRLSQALKESTPELLEEAIKDDLIDNEIVEDHDNQSVKVIGMEVTAHSEDGGTWPSAEPTQPASTASPQRGHEADEVKSIFLETEIPQQSRVLVSEFAEKRTDSPEPKNASLVVSAKMTLSLIQDAPRETPERDAESTVDDFTTASAMTQANVEKDEEEFSEEEIEEVEEEIEIEEIEEEEVEGDIQLNNGFEMEDEEEYCGKSL